MRKVLLRHWTRIGCISRSLVGAPATHQSVPSAAPGHRRSTSAANRAATADSVNEGMIKHDGN